jgi:hypothetical protein
MMSQVADEGTKRLNDTMENGLAKVLQLSPRGTRIVSDQWRRGKSCRSNRRKHLVNFVSFIRQCII